MSEDMKEWLRNLDITDITYIMAFVTFLLFCFIFLFMIPVMKMYPELA